MNIRAQDIMTDGVETVTPDDTISDVLTRLARAEFNGFPVVDDEERVVGIVTQGDLVNLFQPSDRVLWIPIGLPPFLHPVDYAIDASWNDFDVELDLAKHAGESITTVMSEDLVTVKSDDDLDHMLALLSDEERNINRLPVVEGDKLVGIITREDVLRTLRDEREN